MPEQMQTASTTIAQRSHFIQRFPCFAALTQDQVNELVSYMIELSYQRGEQVVTENELVDSIFIIIKGEAEVTHKVSMSKTKTSQVPMAVLHVGEGIGLNDTGFYSTTGERTATVIATTEMLLLRLDIKELYGFLKRYNLELSMYAASLQMLRMRFIKQSLPFSKLSHERLQWLADRVEDVAIPSGSIIFNQGDQGDKCYLIRSGQIEILMQDEIGNERRIAVLKPPVLFGEATLITHTPRNATARAITDCELLVLSHQYLSELIESEENVANMFMTLMVDRSRPIQNSHVSMHTRTTPDGQEVTILKNPDNGSYFKLSAEGSFIWQQLDGKHTLQEITLNLAQKFNIFAPNVVVALISKLTKFGFISNLAILDESNLQSRSFWIKMLAKIRKVTDVRYAFGDADMWVSTIYRKYIHFLFTQPGQILLAILAIIGFSIFVFYTPNILLFFSYEHASLFLLLGLLPLSIIAVVCHELGHAFAVKAFGREVHFIGAGWNWFKPIAFTDTSDMWLSTRKPRMLVNLAGIYVDILLAGLASLSITLLPDHPYIQSMLWLFAFYTYIRAFHMLSPLQELDGYYVLMDWVEKPRLRRSALIWLVNKFPSALRHPSLFKQNLPEISYWIACVIFLILISILTLIVQMFIFMIFGIQPPKLYLKLILPIIAVIFSSINIIIEIRQQKEE